VVAFRLGLNAVGTLSIIDGQGDPNDSLNQLTLPGEDQVTAEGGLRQVSQRKARASGTSTAARLLNFVNDFQVPGTTIDKSGGCAALFSARCPPQLGNIESRTLSAGIIEQLVGAYSKSE
jgi:hypothetical protein